MEHTAISFEAKSADVIKTNLLYFSYTVKGRTNV